MNLVFYLSAAVAVIATIMVITRSNAMHALLYLIVSLLAVALIFFTLGAPFVAALEVIVYAGAIMVLFIFAIMLLNQGAQSAALERQWLRASGWVGPAILSLVLLLEVFYVLSTGAPSGSAPGAAPIPPQQVGAALFTTYLIGVELASILLLASLVGAYHLGQRHGITKAVEREEVELTRAKELKQPLERNSAPIKATDGKAAGAYEVEKER